MKVFFVKVAIFIVLLFVVEVALRLIGFEKGNLMPSFQLVDQVSSDQPFAGTDEGITIFTPNSSILPPDYNINTQGYRNNFDFDKKTSDSLKAISTKPQVFLVGDSYTQGCCASAAENSFADLLKGYDVYNFGVGGADIIQYDLILQNYLEKLNPNLVVIPFYLGNDITADKRTPRPNIPIIYKIKGSFFLSSEIPSSLSSLHSKPYFDSAEEAYNFYLNTYTFWGEDRSLVEQICAKSVILTQLFKGLPLKVRGQLDYYRSFEENKDIVVTNNLLQALQRQSDVAEIPLLLCPIPSPNDAKNQLSLESVYQEYFEGLSVCYPKISNYQVSFYDKTSHFTDEGHLVYANELQACIDQRLSTIAASLAK